MNTPKGKTVAIDLGDAWCGIAISDALNILARPLTTVPTEKLSTFLTELFVKESIGIVVVGYPQTMKGTESDQTKKVLAFKESLEQQFPQKLWRLWDERLSSKRASALQQEGRKKSNPNKKMQEHALAASFILDSFLLAYSEK